MKIVTLFGTRPEIIRLSRVIPRLDRHADQVLVHTGQNSDPNLSDIFYHMEAGNRSYDDRIPGEINRRIIDHCSDVLMPYTHRSKEALVREGIELQRIYVTGNPIYEVLEYYRERIEKSVILSKLGVKDREFFLVTLHRAENVDDAERLESFLAGLARVAAAFDKPVIVSVHPRTADRMKRYNLSAGSDRVRLLPPLGFFEFVKLEKTAFCVMSDSGTVQEECCIFNVPNVTLRDVTERPETIECGSTVLSGCDPGMIEAAVRIATDGTDWQPPSEYMTRNVSQTVTKIVLGYAQRQFDRC